MALNIPFRNAYYRFASSYSFLFFISWSLWWSLYAIWLKGHLGLTGTELGTLYSVNQFTSILFMMFYGIVQDKLGLKKPLIWCMSFILVLTGPFMIYVYEPLLQSNFSVGLILGRSFLAWGIWRDAVCLTASPKKWREIFISNMEHRAPGDLLAMLLARSLPAYFLVSVPISTSGWSRYLALYL